MLFRELGNRHINFYLRAPDKNFESVSIQTRDKAVLNLLSMRRNESQKAIQAIT
jgi:hypothetical protein